MAVAVDEAERTGGGAVGVLGGSIRLSELAIELGVSSATARRDVAALDRSGQARWLHGSVSPLSAPLNARDMRLAGKSQADSSRHVVGMVIPTLEHQFRQIVHGARTVAAAAGIHLKVAVSGFHRSREEVHMQSMVQAGVKGLLLSPSWGVGGPTEAEVDRILALGVPAVLVERKLPAGAHEEGIDHVCSAHAEGAALAVRHLARLGHQRIALLSRNTHTLPYVRSGYLTAIRALETEDDFLSPQERHLGGCFDAFEHDADRLLELRESQGVRAVLVHTDLDAVNMLQRLFLHNLRVPEDLAIVCYSDDYASIADVPLTSIAVPGKELGETAMQLLLRRLENSQMRRWCLELMPKLQVRGSCGGQGTRNECPSVRGADPNGLERA
ncbi:LacI family DNA-binding transcriptional regulator [Streptomyces pathocidini]|uniref:LacI family DNA-binding transcriptional regulator n=1 Tax=Streptomyces pathocidini TaxID=1650571 RepID=UPI003B8A78F5